MFHILHINVQQISFQKMKIANFEHISCALHGI